ncbi:unnamed protein product [Rotaria socialis]|uniref:SUZ domain-containing protein n=1 Tax=Rotaria socialis TaxID=392032 RepID=A0A817MR09_9BILA|nr:unnamed protein product [Rotaria socialis]
MVDTVLAAAATTTTTTTTTTGNDNDDWEVAVDTGEFDKRLEQQEKARAANQESILPAIASTVNDDDSRTSSNISFMNLNKPIRILKRPISQSQLSTTNVNVTNSSIATSTNTITTTAALHNDNNANNSNSPFPINTSSTTTVPVVSIIPRNFTKDSANVSQSISVPVFSSNSLSSQPARPAIKTYEQRELEYRLARLRIMGEEESSAKDDEDNPVVELTPVSTDDTNKPTTSPLSSTSSTTRTANNMSGFSQQSLQCHSTPGSYASNLYALNNVPSNTGAIHFTPNNNSNNSTPNLGTGPYSSPNFPQHYRGAYPTPYSHMPPPPLIPRYPLVAATTTTTLYMTSTAPFVSAPSSSSSPSSVSSSYNVAPQQHPNMATNNWYHYQHSQTPYGIQQYGPPQ